MDPDVYYLDTSILPPFYWPEKLTPAVQTLMNGLETPLISDWTQTEFASALAMRIRMVMNMRRRLRRLSRSFSSIFPTEFMNDCRLRGAILKWRAIGFAVFRLRSARQTRFIWPSHTITTACL